MRNHPAIAYINGNVDISINTDNRGTLNYDYVSYDWFDLFLAFQLPFVTLKNIGLRSTQYASRNRAINKNCLERWQQAYDTFISE
jgi:hypothetical protein